MWIIKKSDHMRFGVNAFDIVQKLDHLRVLYISSLNRNGYVMSNGTMNRPNKIDALYDGLVVMYKAAGMSVKTVDPLPNQTLENFQNTPKPQRPKFGRRLSEAAHSTPVLSSKRTCDGVVLFFQTVITSVDIRTSMDLWLR
jgi:hypothetical protein